MIKLNKRKELNYYECQIIKKQIELFLPAIIFCLLLVLAISLSAYCRTHLGTIKMDKIRGTYTYVEEGSTEEIIAENAACYEKEYGLQCTLNDGTKVIVKSYKKQ